MEASGYGDLSEVLSFRSEWFSVVDRGQLEGHVIFAQDILGNFYTFSPVNEAIHFINRSDPEFAFMEADFQSFMQIFKEKNYQIERWADSLERHEYNW